MSPTPETYFGMEDGIPFISPWQNPLMAVMMTQDMMKSEGPAFAWIGNQPDAKEGILSFLEKRSPEWQMSPDDIPDEFK